LQAIISRTGTVARDELLVDCRGMVLPKAMLGKSENLRLALAPSVGTLSVSIILDGNNLTGDIRLVQKQVQIASRVGSCLNEVSLAAAVDDTLDDVDALATQVSLSGTLDEPTCTLSSNLGPATAEALNRGLRRAADEHARKLIAAAQQRVDLELTQLERQMVEARTEVLPQLAQAADQLEIIAGQQKPPQRISTEHLGRRLPANSLFR
ncbi:MAG TPA: hypothetical protein VJ809_16340, partial [Pirellulales bacterium]|nr:hypothetical protein [Pirellulales bacterium]